MAHVMLFDLVDILQKRRRLLFVAAFIVADVWLLTLCTQTLQAHRSDITARIHSTESYQTTADYQGDMFNVGSLTTGINHTFNALEVGALRAAVSVTDDIIQTQRSVAAASSRTLRTTSSATMAAARANDEAVSFGVRAVAFPFVAVGRGVGYASRSVANLVDSNVASVIRPKQNVTVPVITPEQAQQVSLIQSGTMAFEPVKPIGSGGACDSGAGNGGYPMDWCNARMDTLQTVSYSSDRINRECTSYAYWYFTTVEGHADFHVTGNANRWAYTSSYPVHRAPAIGAIGVETAGVYGHVAIVQAMAGQTFDGKVVPAGYVLVSEMNYDWQGHFRYSYSPLSKFSAYIY